MLIQYIFVTLAVLFLGWPLLGSNLQPLGHLSPTSNKMTTMIFDVTNYGAIGDGTTCDTRAFQSAWKAACKKVTGRRVTITVPKGKTYLVYPLKFEGPCKPPCITFQILGRVVAPPRSAWRNKTTGQWLYFLRTDGLTVKGNRKGIIDGVGHTWWTHINESTRPTAMRFSHCNKLRIRGLKHVNSQQNHISINACNQTVISNLELRAPETSPNTDGIDISNSVNVDIHNCIMATGDDCIAINGGTSDVNISNVACGPGHGISIGSLGKMGRHEEVERISITSCSFNRTQNGVRIKTWQGGSGFARSIAFSNITFIEANNPVIIDQYYCPHEICSNQTSAVQVSDVRFSGLHGTSTSKQTTINLSCSETVPCKNIVLDDVNIQSANPDNSASALCINAHGLANTLNPVVSCLMQ